MKKIGANVPSTLRTYTEFRRVFDNKTRFFRDGLGFYFRKSENFSFRYGISVPKRYGNAVKRNKLRRRMREIIRLSACLPDSVEMVISVCKPCEKFTFSSLKKILEWGFGKVTRGSVPNRSDRCE